MNKLIVALTGFEPAILLQDSMAVNALPYFVINISVHCKLCPFQCMIETAYSMHSAVD